MRILFISPYVPSRIRVRPYYWVTGLSSAGHDVCLFCLTGGANDAVALDEMRRACARVEAVGLPAWRPIVNCATALPGSDPLQLAWSRLPRFSHTIESAVRRERFDVVHIEHLRAAAFAPAVHPLPVVYDAVDSITLLFERTRLAGPRRRDRWMAALDERRTARFEGESLRRFDRVLVSSRADADRIRELSHGHEEPDDASAGRHDGSPVVLPNPVDLEYFRPTDAAREPETVIFSGKMSYHANIAAAQDLVTRVMPEVWRVRPSARVLIVGQNPDRSVRRLADDARVTVTGWVPDLRPFLARATLAVCPLRYGVGIQNKVLEAMAAGLPLVASRQAVQALDVAHDRELAIGESADAIAREIVRLLGSVEARTALAAHGRRYVERHHSPPALVRRLEEVYQNVRATREPRSGLLPQPDAVRSNDAE